MSSESGSVESVDESTFNEFLGSVEKLVRTQLVPAESWVEENGSIPANIVEQMRALGLFGYTIPSEYGGLGLNSAQEVEVVFRLCFASVAYRSLVGPNNGLVSGSLLMAGTEAQKMKYLPDLASGKIVSSFSVTEPDTGSDAANLTTRAERRGDRWILNGTKRYATNAPQAELIIVFARTSPTIKGAKGVSAFLVPRGAPGLSLGKADKKMGQHGSQTCDVILDNCELGADALLGEEGGGFQVAMHMISRNRLCIAAVCVGIGERLLHESLSFALNRKQFGSRIADFQLIQAMLADSQAELAAAKALVKDTARRRDKGESISMEASCCKMFASEAVGRIADRAVQIHGGAGYMTEYPVERLYRDVRILRIYEGTTQIQQITIAKQMIRNAEGSK